MGVIVFRNKLGSDFVVAWGHLVCAEGQPPYKDRVINGRYHKLSFGLTVDHKWNPTRQAVDYQTASCAVYDGYRTFCASAYINAQKLKKNSPVVVFGRWIEFPYVNEITGERVIAREIRVDFLWVVDELGFEFIPDKELKALAKKRKQRRNGGEEEELPF